MMDDRSANLTPVVSEEVTAALAAGLPVVALESTVIAHGLPYPHNLQSALELEETIRSQNAIPATVAVLAGTPRVGLNETELELLATQDEVRKVSRRDLPVAMMRRQFGATTVAATIALADRAGIQVFATGGIGGVHRGGTGDISADLPELARTPMLVVCAGAKAILDLPATLEWLETYGVPVLGYRTHHFPAFYSERSGLLLDDWIEGPGEAAQIAHCAWEWKLAQGILVVAPPPAEEAIPLDALEKAIGVALAECQRGGIRGKEVTPFLLGRLRDLTEGASLTSNMALLRNNAAIAGQIAVELSAVNAAESRE